MLLSAQCGWAEGEVLCCAVLGTGGQGTHALR